MALRKQKSQTQDHAVTESTPQNQPGGQTKWRNGVPTYGWYRMPDDAWWNYMPRLQRGLYQRMLIEYVWARMVPRESDGAMAEVSPWLSYVELAEKWGCTADQIRDDARDAMARGMIKLEESKRLGFRAAVLWDRWQFLKPYVAPAPKLLKKEKVAPSSRWLAGVSVAPGRSYDFLVPDLPEDFRLQKISLRNTGESGEVVFAGGGPAEGGILVFETSAQNDASTKSATSEVIRESTPVKSARGAPPKRAVSGPSADPVIQEIAAIVGTYGPVTIPAIVRMVAASHVSAEKVLQSLSVVKPPENANDAIAWMMSMVPRYHAGTFKPRAAGPKPKSAREQLADEIWGGGKKSA